jgi:hypothetical protein
MDRAWSVPVSLALRRVLLWATVAIVAGKIHAQESNPSVEQSRLFPRTIPPTAGSVTPDGTALPGGETTTSEDESFGAQQILKTQEKIPEFTLGAGASFFYTTNVALTRSDTKSDGFFVGDAAFNWTPRINPELQFQFGGAVSIFRYFDTSALDFQSLGFGTGFTWAPKDFWGMAMVGRYDFTELFDRHSDQILQDHEFSVAVQKLVVLGRSHALSFGVLGSAGVSDPFAEQRDQVGFAIGYHLQLTRQLGSDFGYRHSWYFYNEGGRTDLNQVFSLGLHYNLTPWAALNAFISGATNYSNQSAFKYDVFSTGGGAALTIRF